HFPAFRNCIFLAQLQGVGCAFATDASFLIEEMISWHVGIQDEAARTVNVTMMPRGRIGGRRTLGWGRCPSRCHVRRRVRRNCGLGRTCWSLSGRYGSNLVG